MDQRSVMEAARVWKSQGGAVGAAKNQGEVVVVSFFFREILYRECVVLSDTIFLFEQKTCICI